MIGQKPSTFPTRIKTLDGERQAPTQAELDRMLFDLVIGQLRGIDPGPARVPAVPTDAVLRDHARALGLTVPRSVRERFRDDMLDLLNSPRR